MPEIWTQADMIETAKAQTSSVLVFSANACFTQDDRLVMGAGAAQRVRDYFPNIDRDLATVIIQGNGTIVRSSKVQHDYHIAYVGLPGNRAPIRGVMALQVKRHWRDKALDFVLKKSLKKLSREIDEHPYTQFVLNCPGIGHGGLPAELCVNLIMDALYDFDNVTVCAQNLASLEKHINYWKEKNLKNR